MSNVALSLPVGRIPILVSFAAYHSSPKDDLRIFSSGTLVLGSSEVVHPGSRLGFPRWSGSVRREHLFSSSSQTSAYTEPCPHAVSPTNLPLAPTTL